MNRRLVFASFALAGFAFTLPVSAVVGDPQAGQQKSAACAACHGPDGNASNGQWPNLAGQHADYLYQQLMAYKSGDRQNAVMASQVANLSEQDMHDLAAYYAGQTMKIGAANEDLLAQGRQIYRAGDAAGGVPSCAACHGPAGLGNAPANYPRIGGQNAEYVLTQLQAYAAGERTTDPNGMMRDVASSLSDEEMRAVASYVSGLYTDE
jgi:cytochrome c553